MPTTHDELRELGRRLTEGELEGDVAALDRLATDDFTLVGPLGFVLNKQQWLERYRPGHLHTRALRLTDASTRIYANAAVTIARQIQQAEYEGQPASGEFRATHIAVHDGSGWRLAGVHLSPIAGPPPSPRRTAEEEQKR